MEAFIGFCAGILVGVWFMILIFATSDNWHRTGETIVRTTKTGIICRKDNNYPEINCSLIKEAIGPRKINKEEFKIEDDN
jgi:hypothetical protein